MANSYLRFLFTFNVSLGINFHYLSSLATPLSSDENKRLTLFYLKLFVFLFRSVQIHNFQFSIQNMRRGG